MVSLGGRSGENRIAGSIPVTSVKVFLERKQSKSFRRGTLFVECFAVKLSPLGGLWKHILVSLVRGLNPAKGIWYCGKPGSTPATNKNYGARVV